MWQGTAWGPERWEVRLGRQVVARTEEASGLGRKLRALSCQPRESSRVCEPERQTEHTCA